MKWRGCEKRRIKVKDLHLVELGRRMSGVRMLVADLATMRERSEREFWDRLWEKYPKLPRYGIAYDYITEEIIVKEPKKDC